VPATIDKPADVYTPSVLPGWTISSAYPYEVGVTTQTHGGTYAAYIRASQTPASSSLVSQSLSAVDYRGHRVRWSAWAKYSFIPTSQNGLWMRVQTPSAVTGMAGTGLNGTADWHQVSVVLDVPQDALTIDIGFVLSTTGTLVIDDSQLEVVENTVASTNYLTAPTPVFQDSLTAVAKALRSESVPVNLGFENRQSTPFFDAVPQQSVDWLAQHSFPLATTDPATPLADLAPLKDMIGSAHVVGLGEGSHGTRQYFQVKHRILEYLVSQLGFTMFAMEASGPEANDLNEYVLNGTGDPRVLLSRLYFWTWNTQEVLDMIQWMRQWNASAPASQKVQFLGMDMDFGGATMDSVRTYVARIDPANASYVLQRYACLEPYRNYEEIRGAPGYASLRDADRAACARGIQEVHDLFASQASRYQGASSAALYQLRLHDTRLVQQYEAFLGTTSDYLFVRNQAMAENVAWMKGQGGPNAKIVLWAHNAHITRAATAMGDHLRAMLGPDYVNVGLTMGSGSFNSIGYGSVGTQSVPSVWVVPPAIQGSLESAFAATHQSNLIVDMRGLAAGGPGSSTLRGPMWMRLLSESFDPGQQNLTPVSLPDNFDLLVYIGSTTPSTLLPFIYR
jgi:erythromycin esterase